MTLLTRAEDIAGDHDRGASELLRDLLPLLADAINDGPHTTRDIVRVICGGQRAMAPLWNACAAALAEFERPGRFDRVRAEMERAGGALARTASTEVSALLRGETAPVLLTLSFSSSVAQAIIDGAGPAALRMICAEGRPRHEGRRMAMTMAAAGVAVTVVTDAAITTYLREATAVVVGADAIAAEYWINKVGTFGVAAAAARVGTPVYVIASREKALARQLSTRFAGSAGPPDEVWAPLVPGIAVENPYFERTPAELATLFITDVGTISPSDLPQFSDRYSSDIPHLISHLTP